MAEAAAVTALIRKAIDLISALTVQESCRLYWLREDIKWIQTEMGFLQAYLNTQNHMPGNEMARQLKETIRVIALDTEEVIKKYLVKTGSISSSILGCLIGVDNCSCNWFRARTVSIKIQAIKKRVEDINRVRNTYGISGTDQVAAAQAEIHDPRRPFLHVEEPHMVGFDRDIKELTARLLNRSVPFDVISIIGMIGVGKTTLAKKVYKCCQQSFDCCAFIYVSQEPKIGDLLQDLARQVGLQKTEDKMNMEANLHDHLSNKRYLILFDDIWSRHAWDILKNSIPITNNNGSRLIFTSHNASVGRYVGGESSLHMLSPLNRKKSLQLFKKLVMGPNPVSEETNYPQDLKRLGKKISEKCGGLPLAIVLIAGLLSSRERKTRDWQQVLERVDQVQDEWFKILALTYNELPSDLKHCFLTFGLFPDDYEISSFQLINLWMAEEFIAATGKQDFEDVGADYLENLAARNLIQVASRRYDGTVRSCRIHVLLHRFCVLLAKESSFFHTIDDLSRSTKRKIRRLAIRGCNLNNYIALNQRIQECQALLYFGTTQLLEKKKLKNVLSNFRSLRVLILEFQILQSSFPEEIGMLRHLMYVQLVGCGGHQKLPSTISNLQKLCTLDVRECKLIELPASIWRIKQLRHLLLGGNVVVTPSSRIGTWCSDKMTYFPCKKVSLPCLHTLDAEDGCNLNYSSLSCFTNLRKLRIRNPSDMTLKILSYDGPISEYLVNLRLSQRASPPSTCLDLSSYYRLLKLHLGIPLKKIPNPWEFPPNLIKLTLFWTELEQDPFETLKYLPKLKVLKLGRNSYNGESMVCTGAKSFPQLQDLHINGLPLLKEIRVEGTDQLKKLTIDHCYRLKIISKRLESIRMRSRRS